MARQPEGAMHMAECFWPDVHEDTVNQAAARVSETASALTHAGNNVELTGTIFVPGDDVVLYLFNGSAAAVREACTRARVPFERVVESVWTTPCKSEGTSLG